MPTKKPRKPKDLKIVISRTYSEGQKVNTGNYQSRDFFASATRLMELPSTASVEEQEQKSQELFETVKQEVKTALKMEVEDASGTKPEISVDATVPPPSVPDAFNVELKREYPGKKFVPRPYDVEEMDDDIEL